MTKEEQAKLNEVRNLLLVVSERQRAIREEDLAGIDNHLKDLNGSVLKNTIRSVSNTNINKIFAWIIGLEFLMLSAIIGLLIWIG